MFCILCKKELEYEIEGWVIKNGILIKKLIPFASEHQEKFAYFVICDECLKKNELVYDKYIIITDINNDG